MPRDRTGQIFIIMARNIYSNTSGSSATLSYNQKPAGYGIWLYIHWSKCSQAPSHLFPVISTPSLQDTAHFR